MISPTAISTFLYCPRKLFIERVLKIFKIPKGAILKGKVKHEIFEDINNQDKEIIISIKEKDYLKILNIYKKNYSIIARKKILKYSKEFIEQEIDQLKFFTDFCDILISEAEDKSLNLYNFIYENKIFGEELWEKLTPKIVCELRVFDDKLGLRGVIDELRDYGKIQIPVELKTGKSSNGAAWPSHKAQLAAYILILRNQGHTVTQGIIKYIDEKKEVTIPFNSLLEEELLKQIKQVNSIILSKTIPARVDSYNKCNACQLKEECYNDSFIEDKIKSIPKIT